MSTQHASSACSREGCLELHTLGHCYFVIDLVINRIRGMNMTNLIAIDGGRQGETRSESVARRFREELASLNMKGAAAARLCHKSQPWINRRMNGHIPFTIDELDELCETLKLDYNYIATGIRQIPGPGGDHVSERSSVQSREGAPPLRLVVSNGRSQIGTLP